MEQMENQTNARIFSLHFSNSIILFLYEKRRCNYDQQFNKIQNCLALYVEIGKQQKSLEKCSNQRQKEMKEIHTSSKWCKKYKSLYYLVTLFWFESFWCIEQALN